jgi:hypothetical protein
MSADDHLGVAVQEGGKGRQRGPDPAVIGDAAAVERHVEIDTHQHALAPTTKSSIVFIARSPSTRRGKNPAPGGIPDSGSQRDPAPVRWSGPLAAALGDLRR